MEAVVDKKAGRRINRHAVQEKLQRLAARASLLPVRCLLHLPLATAMDLWNTAHADNTVFQLA
jgi:hypothetical protein